MNFPRIKPVYSPVRLSRGRIRFGAFWDFVYELEDDQQGNVWQLLKLIDGTRTIDTIVSEMQRFEPAFDKRNILEALGTLIDRGLIEDAGASVPAELTPEELHRYARNLDYFSLIDTRPQASPYEHQLRLKKACVTILGLGGTGSVIATSLAAMGVGKLRLVDFDLIQSSNLNRQVLYTENDIGRPKVQACMDHLHALNSLVELEGRELRAASAEDIVPLTEACDFFVLSADTPQIQIQKWINLAALKTNTPWLTGYYSGPSLSVGIFVPFQTPCYECLMHSQESETEHLPQMSVVNPVIAPTAGMTAYLGALEVVNYLTDLQPQTVGRIFRQSLRTYDEFLFTTPSFWPECPMCGDKSPYRKANNANI